MDPSHRLPVAEWLRASRGAQTQDDLAQDITRVTRWNIDRTRYSRYESGTLPIGKKVLGHFRDYWATRGVPGPESLVQPTPPADPQDRVIAAIDRQTQVLEKVLTALQERTMDPSAVRALQEWAVAQATTRQQRQTGDPVSSPGQ